MVSARHVLPGHLRLLDLRRAAPRVLLGRMERQLAKQHVRSVLQASTRMQCRRQVVLFARWEHIRQPVLQVAQVARSGLTSSLPHL